MTSKPNKVRDNSFRSQLTASTTSSVFNAIAAMLPVINWGLSGVWHQTSHLKIDDDWWCSQILDNEHANCLILCAGRKLLQLIERMHLEPYQRRCECVGDITLSRTVVVCWWVKRVKLEDFRCRLLWALGKVWKGGLRHHLDLHANVEEYVKVPYKRFQPH